MLQSPVTTPQFDNIIAQDVKVNPYPKSNTPNTIKDSMKLAKEHPDMKKKLAISNRLSNPSVISMTPPSTPLPLSARNNSFSSSQQSFQSIQSEQLLDHSHLKPGENASLLSYDKTINMYRENAKKTNNMDIQCDFAIFLVEASKRLQDNDQQQRQAYIMEAEKILKQSAIRGHSESQYYLANMHAAGLLNKSDKPDFEKAFPLFVQSAKHHHPDAAYRAAKCYEDGLGTRKDKSKAVQYYRKAGTLNHPGAMYRLGLAEMKGELSLSRNVRDGHKWLKRSAEAATTQYPHALHELAYLHEKGCDNIIFVDHSYAVTLYHEASTLGYAPSAHRLGECYEFGNLGCQVNPTLSIQYYSIGAEQNYPESCFALTAWYLVGVPQVLPPSDEQAYAWALIAAQSGLPRAEYAIGYFSEMGIGTTKDENSAMSWYRKAAEHGEKRAIQRLQPTIPLSTNSPKKRLSKPLPTVGMSSPNNNTKRMSFISISGKSQSNFFQRASTFLRKSEK